MSAKKQTAFEAIPSLHCQKMKAWYHIICSRSFVQRTSQRPMTM